MRNEGERVRDYASGNRVGTRSRSHSRQWVCGVGGKGGGWLQRQPDRKGQSERDVAAFP